MGVDGMGAEGAGADGSGGGFDDGDRGDGREVSAAQRAALARAALWQGDEAGHRAARPTGTAVVAADGFGPGPPKPSGPSGPSGHVLSGQAGLPGYAPGQPGQRAPFGPPGNGASGSRALVVCPPVSDTPTPSAQAPGSFASGGLGFDRVPSGPLAPLGPEPRADALHRLAHHWWFGPVGTGTPTPAADPWTATADELSRVWAQPGDPTAVAAAERLLRNCRLADDTLEALMTAVLALVLADRAGEAEDWWRTLKTEADRRGAVAWQAVLVGLWSSAVLRGGDATYAAALARHALSLLPERDWGAAIADPLATLLAARTVAGEYDLAAQVLARDVPVTVERTAAGVRFLRARGHYHLATGRLLAAVNDFTGCGRILIARGTDLPGLVPWRADLAEAYLALGNADAARELADEQLARAAAADRHTRGLALRVSALAGDADDVHATLQEAAALLAAGGDHGEAQRTARMLDRAPGHRSGPRAAGRFGDDHVPSGRRGLPGAPELTVVSGSLPAPWASGPRAAGRVAVPGPITALGLAPAARPDREPDPHHESEHESESDSATVVMISQAERRVAALAASGLTNQEISATLAITVSTVEQHLTRVYRKLRIRGRADLAAGLEG